MRPRTHLDVSKVSRAVVGAAGAAVRVVAGPARLLVINDTEGRVVESARHRLSGGGVERERLGDLHDGEALGLLWPDDTKLQLGDRAALRLGVVELWKEVHRETRSARMGEPWALVLGAASGVAAAVLSVRFVRQARELRLLGSLEESSPEELYDSPTWRGEVLVSVDASEDTPRMRSAPVARRCV
jgi:hypothetical protein